jgi:iron(III) transport system substrate-binding protein
MRHAVVPGLVIAFWMLFASALQAYEIEGELRVGDPAADTQLRIISTTDIDLFEPLLAAFVDANPEIAIDYVVASSAEVMKAVQSGDRFDLALSSAMDLQTKLSNDGYTQPYSSAATDLVPDWGNWRDHLFAFSQETVTLVISPAAFEGLEIPQTRQDLIRLLRDHEDRFRGRIGTYDISQSGAGYLFATQDARASETYWRVSEVMGNLGTRFFCCTSEMIEKVATGEIAMAYNVLGSYAAARTDLAYGIRIVELQDYTIMMLRTAAILRDAPNPETAGLFIDHLIRAAWGPAELDYYPFPRFPAPEGAVSATRRPIRLGPGLLVYLDGLKRRAFLSEWRDAMRW